MTRQGRWHLARLSERGVCLLTILYFSVLPWSVEMRLPLFALRLPAEGILELLLSCWTVWAALCRFRWRRLHAWFGWAGLWLGWMWVCVCLSSMPLVSFKYALAETMQVGGIALVMATMPRLWPVALPFFLYSLGGVVLYTLFHHALHHFRSDQALLAPMPFFPEHTQYAAVLCLALPWALGLCPILSKSTILSTILSKSSRLGKYKRFTYERLRYKHLLLPALLLTGLLFSTCRAAWASLAGPLVLAVVCRLNSAAFHSRFRWLSYTFWGSVAIGGAVLLQHAFTTLAATDVSWAERLNRYDCASQMALARPLTGFGPGTFQFQYIPFQRAEKMTRISSRTPVMERTIHTYGRGGGVHSEYAQAAAEMGWPGAVLWSAGVACLLWMLVFGQAATAFEEKTGLSSWVPLFSLLAFFLHAFVNNFLHEGIVAALVWGQIGYLFSNSHHLGRKGRGL